MILDVSQIIANDGAVMGVSGDIKADDFSFNGQEIRFVSPVSVSGEIRNMSGTLYLELDCRAHFETDCSRCLDKIEENLEFRTEERFSVRPSDDEVIFIDTYVIDLDDFVLKSFCSQLPISFVCSKDCKGLCHVCGCNLNHTTCDCEDDCIDPRLAALKDFLK